MFSKMGKMTGPRKSNSCKNNDYVVVPVPHEDEYEYDIVLEDKDIEVDVLWNLWKQKGVIPTSDGDLEGGETSANDLGNNRQDKPGPSSPGMSRRPLSPPPSRPLGKMDPIGTPRTGTGLGFPKLDKILTPDQKLRAAQRKFQTNIETAEIVFRKCADISERIGLHSDRYCSNGISFLPHAWESDSDYSETLNTFYRMAGRDEGLLKRLRKMTDETSCQMFAHRLFLMAVYRFPRYAYAVCLYLKGMIEVLPELNYGQRNCWIFEKLTELLVAVLNRKTIFDESVIPGSIIPCQIPQYVHDDGDHLSLEELNLKLPKVINIIRSDEQLLQNKLQVRHLNAATLLSYLICCQAPHADKALLNKILLSLTFKLDLNKFHSVCRILTICGQVDIANAQGLMNKCFSRMSRFFDQVYVELGPDSVEIQNLRSVYKEAYCCSTLGQEFDTRKVLRQVFLHNNKIPTRQENAAGIQAILDYSVKESCPVT